MSRRRDAASHKLTLISRAALQALISQPRGKKMIAWYKVAKEKTFSFKTWEH